MEIVLAVLGALAGFAVGQANGWLERRYEKRKTLNRALSELLEIRHRYLSSTYMLKILAEEKSIPYGVLDEVIKQMPDGVLWEKGISDRFGNVVSAISEHNPYLAFLLRSKDYVGFFCGGAPVVFGNTEESHGMALKNLQLAEKAMLPALEEAILELARIIGKEDERKVSEIISESRTASIEVVDFVNELLGHLRDFIRKAQASSAVVIESGGGISEKLVVRLFKIFQKIG